MSNQNLFCLFDTGAIKNLLKVWPSERKPISPWSIHITGLSRTWELAVTPSIISYLCAYPDAYYATDDLPFGISRRIFNLLCKSDKSNMVWHKGRLWLMVYFLRKYWKEKGFPFFCNNKFEFILTSMQWCVLNYSAAIQVS